MIRLAIVASLVLAGAANAQAPNIGDGKGIETTHRNLRAETEIRKRYEEFTDAFNRHDTKTMAAMWTYHGDHYEPDGRFAEGRKAVEKLFEEEHTTAFKNAEIDLTIDTVWMITPNVALVNGFYRVTGLHDLDGNEIAIRRGHLTSVLLLEDGQWWVSASRATIPVPVPWREPPPGAARP
jgi:uncharacterized protein (TIGR02246 family)